MQFKYPPRRVRGIRQDQPGEMKIFAACEVRVFAARRTAESFTWVEVEVPGLCGEPGLPLMIVARRRR